jgi:2',3'-cyclic-nucleotide 2'-phosphodiesterase (5'-nucleotidase family)
MLDLDVKGGKVADFRYKLLSVISSLLLSDPALAALMERVRSPYKAKLEEGFAVTREAIAAGGEPVCDVIARYLRAQKTIAPRAQPAQVEGASGNSGLARSVA